MTNKKEETKENPHLNVKVKKEIEESMKKQGEPEKDVEREKLEDEIKAKIKEAKLAQPKPGEVTFQEDKSEEEKQAEKWVEEAETKENEEPDKKEEPLPEGVAAVEETEGPSIKKQHELEQADKRKFDLCPFCGTHAMEGAIQPKIPLPIGDPPMLIALPMLICIRCTNAYMPRSFVQQLLTPETEKPRIITP